MGSSPSDRRAAENERARLALAVFAPASLAVVELALLLRAPAFLRDDAALARLALLAHLTASLGGMATQKRARWRSPARAPALLFVTAVASALVHAASVVAFADERAFPPFLVASAIVTGALAGASGAALARQLASLRFPAEAALDLASPRGALGAIAIAVIGSASVEWLGSARAAVVASAIAAFVAISAARIAPRAVLASRIRSIAPFALVVLAVALVVLERVAPIAETSRLPDPLVAAIGHEDERIVLTSGRGAFELYVSGRLRLSTLDGARRREALVHPAMASIERRERVLVVGGGEGAAARELLRHADVREITIVDPEPHLLEFARHQPVLARESSHFLDDPRVRAVTDDPVRFLAADVRRYDAIVVDLLPPDLPRRSKLATTWFDRLLREHLAEGGVMVVAAPSPFSERRAFWCVVATLEAAGFRTTPYRIGLPSSGVAGFVLAAIDRAPYPSRLPLALEHLDDASLATLFALAPDEARVDAEPSTLHRQTLRVYRDEATPF